MPILFIVFNRPSTTTKVFEVIRKVKPSKLYIAADGPRLDVLNEEIKTQEVRNYILNNIDWNCEIKTLFRDKNVGCKEAVSSAITWMFEYEEAGIILEDDCLPHLDFFTFCEEMLEKYKYDVNIATITGNNFQNRIQRGSASYYFSKYNHVWGWATWKRAWQEYSDDLPFLEEWLESKSWREINSNFFERRYWKKIFTRVRNGEISTAWDYPWTACLWYRQMLTITPNVNLVSNIGFGEDSTHTSDVNSPLNNIPCLPIHDIVHPNIIRRNVKADLYTYKHVFGGGRFSSSKFFINLLKYGLEILLKIIKKVIPLSIK